MECCRALLASVRMLHELESRIQGGAGRMVLMLVRAPPIQPAPTSPKGGAVARRGLADPLLSSHRETSPRVSSRANQPLCISRHPQWQLPLRRPSNGSFYVHGAPILPHVPPSSAPGLGTYAQLYGIQCGPQDPAIIGAE